MPFFFPAPYHPNVYTLSLHDALPISVLEYWILQLELEFEQDLSPVRLLRVGEDPTLVVLGLDDEHSEPRNEDVINLGCAVLQLEGDVIHQVIVRKTEVRLHDVG